MGKSKKRDKKYNMGSLAKEKESPKVGKQKIILLVGMIILTTAAVFYNMR